MIYLNYNNLDAETQEHLLSKSKKDVVKKFGDALLKHSNENEMIYESLLEEEAIRHLYNYNYTFSI